MARSPDLVYDVGHYLASRHKAKLSMSDFLGLVGQQLFIIEYLVNPDNEHVITWSRLRERLDDKLIMYDARIYDDPESTNSGMIVIPFDDIIAVRYQHKRYNWNKLDRMFIQE